MIRNRSINSASVLSLEEENILSPSPDNKDSRAFSPIKGRWRYIILIMLLIGILVYVGLSYTIVPVSTRLSRKKQDSEEITVVLNTFRRPELMADAVSHYSSCDCVSFIYIVWSESVPPPEDLKTSYANMKSPKVNFLTYATDSLNNRFKPITGPHSEIIFAVDDDMRVPCVELELGQEVFRGSSQSIIGFMPRIHVRGAAGYIYRCWWRVWWYGAYSIILTKAAFLHHRYFHIYTNIMPEKIRKYVDDSRNCEDLAMQFLVSNITGLPPIYIKGHLTDLGVLNGISTSKNVISAGHMDKRSDCLNDLVKLYDNKLPLVKSHIIIDAATNKWTNEPSTWWEYISSDLWNFDNTVEVTN